MSRPGLPAARAFGPCAGKCSSRATPMAGKLQAAPVSPPRALFGSGRCCPDRDTAATHTLRSASVTHFDWQSDSTLRQLMNLTARFRLRSATLLGSLALFSFCARSARAEEWERPYLDASGKKLPTTALPRRQLAGQRYIGILLNLGDYTGFGTGVQLGIPNLSLRLTVGLQPLFIKTTKLISYGVYGTYEREETEVYTSALFGAEACINLFPDYDAKRGGLQVGYRFDTLLGSGLSVGIFVGRWVARPADFYLSAGILGFPNGAHRLRREVAELAGAEFGSPGPSIQLGISVMLAFFPG